MSEEELLPYRRPNNNNRLLLEGSGLIEEEEKEDDGFLRSGGMGAGMSGSRMPAQRNLSPLVEQERSEPESKPYLMSRGKANFARQIYDRKQAEKNPWKKGMPYSRSVLNMFDTSTPYEKKMFGGIRNPRQAVNLEARRPGGFQKLFGAKMSQDELKEREAAGRAPKASFWGRLKASFSNGGKKRSWMERLFGARRRPSKSAASMGITSTNAPMGESSGWADQLIQASKDGRLDQGGRDVKSAFNSNPAGAAPASEGHRSYENYDSTEEQKQPALRQAVNNPRATGGYGGGKNEDANHQTVDDNSIDQDDEQDNDNQYDQWMQYYGKAENSEDEESEEEDEKPRPNFPQDFILSQLKK